MYIPGAEYVGVKIVTHTTKSAYDITLTAGYHADHLQDKGEYIVRIEWIKTVEQNDAVLEEDFFSNQSIVARPIADI